MTVIDCSDNSLKQLSPSIAALRYLKELHLARNGLCRTADVNALHVTVVRAQNSLRYLTHCGSVVNCAYLTYRSIR